MSYNNRIMTIQHLLKTLSPILDPKPEVAVEPEPEPLTLKQTDQPKQKRCGCCTKKLAITDFTCDKCKTRFCLSHRLPEEHKCGHDYKAAGQQQLTNQLVAAVADKVADRL
jgi:hypothetical protein